MTPATPAVPAGYAAAAPPPPGVAPAAVPVATGGPVPDEEIRVYGHSNLFYWWPVWAVGFLMAALTYADGHVMAIVPEGTTVEAGQLVPPAGQTLPPASAKSDDPSPRLRVAANNNYGVVFVGTVLLAVLVTNLTLRGLASIIAVALLVITGLTLALFGWWDDVFRWLGGVDVRMNAGGYLAIAIPLFLIWLFVTFVYDHYTYLIVTRGQVRIRKEIGEGELAVDASGLLLEKKRDDLFRHWLIGLGSGDLHVKTGMPANLDFELPNVLFIGWKLAKIQDKIREKEVAHQAATG
jgi:hypothetical protein